MLVVGATVVAGQLTWLQVVHHYQGRQGSQFAAQQVASIVELQHHALHAMPESARAGYMKRLEQQRRIRFEPVVPGILPGQEPDGPGIKAMAEQLRSSIGSQVVVRVEYPPAGPLNAPPDTGASADSAPAPNPATASASNPAGEAGPPAPPGRRIWVKLPIGRQEMWMVISQRRPPPPPSWVWLEWGMMVMVLAIGASVFVILRIRAPLRELSRAALQIGRGEEPSPIAGRGPAEIDELQKSFAQMQADLKRIESDRALVLAGISHDLRTPLARMRLSAEMLSTDPAARDGMVSDIEEMDAIINQFLDFARDAAGEAMQSANINNLVSNVAEHYGKLNHRIVLLLSPIPDIPMRAVGMRRLITNLVDNALRYGGGEVEIETMHVTDNNRDEVVLEVRDRGPGIAAADLEHVKQPFTRLDPARGTGSGAGAGLGLAIAERVARIHRGNFELCIREGGGLIARVRLPIASA